jgi:hypothetical protein
LYNLLIFNGKDGIKYATLSTNLERGLYLIRFLKEWTCYYDALRRCRIKKITGRNPEDNSFRAGVPGAYWITRFPPTHIWAI